MSATERSLKAMWESERPPFPVLRAMRVSNLRGIRELKVRFAHPVTAICGGNGSGKTTLLALVALAFESKAGHLPPGALRKPHPGDDFTYYTFRDFFFRGPNDPDYSGVGIDWHHDGALARMDGRAVASPLSVRKQSNKWMRYERRPERAVYFLGALRSIPAVEQRVLRSHFGHTRATSASSVLTTPYLGRLGDIMRRTYRDAATVSASRYAIRHCATGEGPYSSFNMGAGEDILIEILHTLQDAPDGSLIVVEEIELGLHPHAVTRLAQHLQEIALQKKLQIVASTHSHQFLDALPRQARILIQREGDAHQAIHGPTARFAVGAMSGTPTPELLIYCEDPFAERLIGVALTSSTRRRAKIIPVGSSSELARQAGFHLRAGLGQRALIVWHGDVTDPQALSWVRAALDPLPPAEKVSWTRLPGGLPPEDWVLECLAGPGGAEALAREIRCETSRASEIISALGALTDGHRIAHELGSMETLQEEEAAQKLVNAVRSLEPNPLASLAACIEETLDGAGVQQPAPVGS